MLKASDGMSPDGDNSIINITPNVCPKGLYEALQVEANRRGMRHRLFAGMVLSSALNDKEKYLEPLENPLPRGGNHISVVVPKAVKHQLRQWARQRGSSLSGLCAYILERELIANQSSDQ